MCEECGCSDKSIDHHHHTHETNHGSQHTHSHTHAHTTEKKVVELNVDVMDKNNRYAAANREFLKERGIFAINLISSPGSGKTSLLERLAGVFGSEMAVVEGDIQTSRDAERVIRAGSRAYQIETGGACHLDAHSVGHALEHLDLTDVKLLIMENVGNLVCPSTYDLGENVKAGILSLPEGDDKILKYPALFSRIGILFVNKIDLAPYLEFDIEKALNECKSLNRHFDTFKVSARSGEGIDVFCDWLREQMKQMQVR